MIDTSNGTNFYRIYEDCINAKEFPQLNTSKGTNFAYMYYNCISALKVSDISLLSIDINNITSNLHKMLYNCNSLSRIVFYDVPTEITEEQLRKITYAPKTVNFTISYKIKK